MIRRLFTTIFLIALIIIIAMLAVANRHPVKVSLDPFSTETPAFTTMVPLFLIVLISLTAGAIIGGSAAWLRQRKWRRAARRSEAELRGLRAEAEGLRDRLSTAEPAVVPSDSRAVAYHRSTAA
jgi:uncharacterized integral membrane protein